MTRIWLVALGLSLAGGKLARAQIIQEPIGSGEPKAWTSLSIGWFSHQRMCDGATSACWDFGGAPQWRGTLGLPIGRGASFGVAVTTARVPLVYSGGVAGANTCPGLAASCDADAYVTQYLANVAIAGGTGFHQVIDLSAGMSVYSGFRSTSGAKLGSGSTSNVSFAVGYGFGYSLSPRTQIMIVQDYGLVILKRTSGSSANTAQQSTLRVGGRFGLGGGRR